SRTTPTPMLHPTPGTSSWTFRPSRGGSRWWRPSPASRTTSCPTPTTRGRAGAGRSTTVDSGSLGRHSRTVGQVTIRLLGGFGAASGGKEVPDGAWRLRKGRELVKLLALARGHRLHREQLMDALWPELDPSAAANNLNQTVHVARRALGASAIEA